MDENSEYGQFGRAGEGGNPYNPYGDYSGHHPHKESVIPLREMTITEQFEAATRMIGFNPATLLGLPFVIYLLYTIAMPLVGLDVNDLIHVNADMTLEMTGSTAQFITYFVVSYLVMMLIAITTINTVMNGLFGRKLGIGQALSMSLSDIPRLLVAIVCYFAFMFILVFGLTALYQAAPSAGVLAIMLLLTFVGLIYLAVRLAATIPALVTEQLGPVTAISRSLRLSKGHAGFLFGSFLLLFLVMFISTFVISAVFGFIGALLPTTIVAIISSAVVSTITGSVAMTITTIFYINLRNKSEGFHRYVEEHI